MITYRACKHIEMAYLFWGNSQRMMWTKDNIKQDYRKMPDCYSTCEEFRLCEGIIFKYENFIALMEETEMSITPNPHSFMNGDWDTLRFL